MRWLDFLPFCIVILGTVGGLGYMASRYRRILIPRGLQVWALRRWRKRAVSIAFANLYRPNILGPILQDNDILTLPAYPKNPSEAFVEELQHSIQTKFGLSPLARYELRNQADALYSPRYLPNGRYNLYMTRVASRIRRLDSHGESLISIGGMAILSRSGEDVLLQIDLRISSSPNEGYEQDKVKVQVDTGHWKVLEKMPENETRTLAISSRSGWNASVKAGFQAKTGGEVTALVNYGRSQESHETLKAWRTVSRDHAGGQGSRRHLLHWLFFGRHEIQRSVGMQWELEHIKEAGSLSGDAQATHLLAKEFSIVLQITPADMLLFWLDQRGEIVLPISIECMLRKQLGTWRQGMPDRMRYHRVNMSTSFLLNMLIFCRPTLEVFPDVSTLDQIRAIDDNGREIQMGITGRRSLVVTPQEMDNIQQLFIQDQGSGTVMFFHKSIFPQLELLDMSRCYFLVNLVLTGGDNEPVPLQTLRLDNCFNLQRIDGLSSLHNLQDVSLKATGLKSLAQMRLPANLQRLCVANCNELKELGDIILGLGGLVRLDLSSCTSIDTWPNFPGELGLREQELVIQMYRCNLGLIVWMREQVARTNRNVRIIQTLPVP